MLDHHQWVVGPWPNPLTSERKLRLFACACCRACWPLLTDDAPCPKCGPGWFNARLDCGYCGYTGRVNRSRKAVEVAERFADGLATEEELAAAREAQTNVRGGWCAHWAVSPQIAQEIHYVGRRTDYQGDVQRDYPPPALQAALLRDIVGNPFRPTFNGGQGGWQKLRDLAHWLHWRAGCIPALARDIYDNRRWELMPVLADALSDAGCDDADVLHHLRGLERCIVCVSKGKKHPRGLACDGSGWVPAGPHVRGCWVVDLILGKG